MILKAHQEYQRLILMSTAEVQNYKFYKTPLDRGRLTSEGGRKAGGILGGSN